MRRLLRRLSMQIYRWRMLRDYQRSARRREALRKRYETLLRPGPDPPDTEKESMK